MQRLRTLLCRFIDGPDRSISAANEIEGLIASNYPPEDPLQELAEDLAQYSPRGGNFLYSEEEMIRKITVWLRRDNAS
jgi:hypothetical protein